MILIRSENPFYESSEAGYREKEMAEYLADRMSSLGLHVEAREVRPYRPNVFGYLNGTEGLFTLMLAGHMVVAKVLTESGVRLKGNLIVCGIRDEEYQMLGSKAIGLGGPKAHQGIIGEPSNFQIYPSNKGRVSTKIITRGLWLPTPACRKKASTPSCDAQL